MVCGGGRYCLGMQSRQLSLCTHMPGPTDTVLCGLVWAVQVLAWLGVCSQVLTSGLFAGADCTIPEYTLHPNILTSPLFLPSTLLETLWCCACGV